MYLFQAEELSLSFAISIGLITLKEKNEQKYYKTNIGSNL
jgi:hypothetical protein